MKIIENTMRTNENEETKSGELFLRQLISRYKRYCGCKYCPEKEPACLDLHHRNPADKIKPVSILANDACSLKKLKSEIRKCDVVCANCHRKLHAGLI